MRFVFSALLLGFSILPMADAKSTIPDELSGTWVLTVENMEREPVTIIKFKFTSKIANSCLGGDWHQININSIETKEKSFFPIKNLSYELKDNRITIGSNEICDAYLHVSGMLKGSRAEGEYFSFGWNSKTLGYFVLVKDGAKGS